MQSGLLTKNNSLMCTLTNHCVEAINTQKLSHDEILDECKVCSEIQMHSDVCWKFDLLLIPRQP